MVYLSIGLVVLGAILSSMYPPFRFNPEKAKVPYLVVRIIGVLLVLAGIVYLCSVVHGWIVK